MEKILPLRPVNLGDDYQMIELEEVMMLEVSDAALEATVEVKGRVQGTTSRGCYFGSC